MKLGHEASVSKIGEEQLFYLMSRGLSEDEARKAIVLGFLEPVVDRIEVTLNGFELLQTTSAR